MPIVRQPADAKSHVQKLCGGGTANPTSLHSGPRLGDVLYRFTLAFHTVYGSLGTLLRPQEDAWPACELTADSARKGTYIWGCVEAAATLPFAALAHHFTRPRLVRMRALRLLHPSGSPVDSTGKREETMTARRNVVAAASDYGCRSYCKFERELA
ncbi:hypothetical protein BN2476_630013 [Paraburkholderia piptadeniae]|uniref:Uncharacterized protein n=1 Tax=Paraburkholderia piptadeniae TaxID=1701573 RepID=A0A1N7SLF4_9BURK|nr:hypothetical protein BN2476_630013 [Paraburkholderia piptadeniae]